MHTDTEIENQEVLIADLRDQMPIWEHPDTIEKSGYIATSTTFNRVDTGDWTDGIEYKMLDEDTVAWRYSGDWRDNSEWTVSHIERFREIVVEDAVNTLDDWREAEENDEVLEDIFS